jgi:4-amino-4-deoxy-L-arabinose transferase-like glycosyltransferase
MTNREFRAALAAILLLAALLRGLFPTADPPWRSTVGVVWHDEGAWTHNARNKALYGAWVQDQWNPVYIAPVFTGLEYAAFELFGVGLRQARLVTEAAGVLSVLLLALGVRRVSGNAAGVYAGALAASSYVYVTYDRAATMEGLMAAFIVASWFCSARAEREPRWGAAAGVMAALAFFTKAAAAFYVGALGLAAIMEFIPREGGSHTSSPEGETVASAFRRNRVVALWTLAGLAAAFAVIGALFVLPHWRDYQFYNWQISVTRKPSYDLASLAQRVTWFPVLHDTLSRAWPELFLTLLGAWQIASRWRQSTHAERLLLLWVALGSLELLVHDDGNERRYVFLLPAMAAFAALALARRVFEFRKPATLVGWLAVPLVFYCCYVAAAPLVRLLYLHDVHEHVLRSTVRLSAAAALIGGALTLFVLRRKSSVQLFIVPAGAVLALIGLVSWDLYQFAGWAHGRTYKNYEAMVALGAALPPGTPVQGKLANGMALENRIRPIFIGHGFGNYADRKERDDVRYILTYTDPKIGYEGSQIEDVLAAYPGWRIIMMFPVAESPSGHDTAALIEKRARH